VGEDVRVLVVDEVEEQRLREDEHEGREELAGLVANCTADDRQDLRAVVPDRLAPLLLLPTL
jgi:hypothetical protein